MMFLNIPSSDILRYFKYDCSLKHDCNLPISAPDAKVLLFCQINYLGTRTTDSKGKPGPYTWMTYAQV